ncbi:MAG: redoxin domain-containing protein [Planctomycetota bacterium]
MRSITALLAAAGLALGTASFMVPAQSATAQEAAQEAAPTLGVGDKAPALEVAEWVKGEKITSFEPDGTYVVEFWATWCGPCIRSIPHVTELAHKYKDDGLKVVGVSVWENDWSKVNPFVENMGDQMDYSVAMDGEAGKMSQNWMRAAGRNGIPSAFIVHDQTIAWVGHPMEMDSPLEQIMAGEYNIAEAKNRAAREQELQAQAAPLMQSAQQKFSAGDVEGAIAELDQIIALDGEMFMDLALTKFQLLAVQLGDLDRAYAYGRELESGMLKDNPQALNGLAWMILTADAFAGNRDGELALQIATRASKLTDNNDAMVLDTVAKAQFELGQIKSAIETQRRAVELDEDEEYKIRLDEYERALESGQG